MPRLTVYLIWGFCLAAIVGDLTGWAWVQQTAALFLVIALARDARLWAARSNGKLALLLLGTALVLAGSGESMLRAFLGITNYTPVIALLLCISLIRLPMNASGIEVPLRGLLARVGRGARPGAVMATSVALAPMLNLGTLPFMSSFLKGRSQPDTMAPTSVTRGIGMSMLWAPSFAPIALVMAAFPNVSWVATLPIAMTLLVGSAMLGAWLHGDIEVGAIPQDMHWGRLWFGAGVVGTVLFTSMFARLALHAPLTAAVSTSGVAVLGFWLVFAPAARKDSVHLLSEHTQRMWQAVIAESALFATSGVLAEVLKQPHWAESLRHWFSFLNQPTWGSMATLLFGVPLMSVVGIHPIVPFSILAHTITTEGLHVTAPVLYMTWVMVWVLSLLLSPISALNLSASAAFGVSSWRLGFQSNWRYSLGLGIAALFVLRLWSQ